jgi:predicted DNA-binding transcriptional regulator YafY
MVYALAGMFVSHKEFIKRTTLFLSLLKERKYVSARMLGECCQCSRETARQLINYLIDEYQVPLEYDQANHGYYLKDPSYSFSLPPVDQSELNVLILLQAIAKGLNAECLLTESSPHAWGCFYECSLKCETSPAFQV